MTEPIPSPVTREILDRSVHHLRDEFLPRIERALEVLPAADLWWRPNEESTSVANLILHLEGNVRQWMLSGLGQQPDRRERSSEFVATGSSSSMDSTELLGRLRGTVVEACELIEGLDDDELLRRHDIQVFEGVTGLAAILHVVEHFAWHTGQIAYVAKMRAARSLGYYDDPALE